MSEFNGRRLTAACRVWLAAITLAFGFTASCAARPEFDIAPTPAWVHPVAPSLKDPLPGDALTQGVRALLVDSQVLVEARDRVRYRHLATQATTTESVESQANISIGFDPSFERLTLHFVRVVRGDRHIDKLRPTAVRILQRESGLESLVYDGSKTASLFLDDVRVGDVVEYAYSLRGNNPVFDNKAFGRVDLQWSAPVAHAHARLLWPISKPIYFKEFNQPAAAHIKESGAYREYLWDLHGIAGLNVENDAPRSFDPYASVQWSEFPDWHSVAMWALPLYRAPTPPSSEVAELAQRLSSRLVTPGDRLFAALRHVQAEVRYLGIEVGAGSHAPSPPDLVLRRRFGDCKDKAMLTVALLQAMGIEARPALVHTGMQSAVRDWQPSPASFNHVVVMARIKDKPVWVDPTRAPQEGGFAHLAQVDFGLALVVDERTDQLVPMAGAQARIDQRKIHTVIDSRSGLDKPVTYTVSTVMEGLTAEKIRAWLASESREKVQQQYTNFYAPYFEGIQADGPIEVSDDAANNRLTTTEHYRIPAFWKHNDAKKRLEGAIEVPDVDMVLRTPKNQVRSAPLVLNHPFEVVQVTEIRLPKPWDVKPDNARIDHSAFVFERQEAWNGNTLVLTDRFATKAEQVASADMPGYTSQLAKARQTINYVLYSYDPVTDAKPSSNTSPHWIPAVAGVLATLGWLALAWYAWCWNPPPIEGGMPAVTGAPAGLGGWLGVLGVMLVWGCYLQVRSLGDITGAISVDAWPALTQPGSAQYHPLWSITILLEIVGGLGTVIMRLLLIVTYFQRRSSFPRLFVWVLVGSMAYLGLDFALGSMIPATAAEYSGKQLGKLLAGSLGGVLWALYLMRSRRVRNTFVRSRPATRWQRGTASAA